MRKVVFFSSLNNYDKEYHRTLLYGLGAKILDHRTLKKIWIAASSHATYA
jgi:hypothetical protein